MVAFPPGGLTDAYARMYAEQLTARLGVAAFVENKPGGGAIIGIDTVAKSPADGYTLLMTTSGTVWQNRVLYTKLPYNLDKDLTPIANFPSGPLVVGVSEKVPARNMREFIEFAKINTTAMGTYAPGSYPHMVADQINRTRARRFSRCITAANRRCGWTWRRGRCRLPLAASRPSTPSRAGESGRSGSPGRIGHPNCPMSPRWWSRASPARWWGWRGGCR
jgi:hypothetical protein